MYIVHVVHKKATLVYKLEAVLRASHYQLFLCTVRGVWFKLNLPAASLLGFARQPTPVLDYYIIEPVLADALLQRGENHGHSSIYGFDVFLV